MDTFLPWAAIVAALVSLFLAAKPWTAAKAPSVSGPTPFWNDLLRLRPVLIGIALVALSAIGAAWISSKSLSGILPASYGFAIGAAMAALAEICERGFGNRAQSLIAPIGIATGAVGATLLAPRGMLVPLQLGIVFGSGLGAALLDTAPRTQVSWARLSCIFAACISGASIIGFHRTAVERAARVPVVFALLAIVSIALAFGWRDFTQTQRGGAGVSKFWTYIIGGVVFIAGARLISVRYLYYGNSFWIALGSVTAAGFVAWVLSDESEDEPGPFAIATLIWLGWTTVAYGLLQGFGVGIAAVTGIFALFLIGSMRGLLSFGIVLALVFYRVFLEQYSSAARAIDIGQTYSVIGIVAGAALPIAVLGWVAGIRQRYSGTLKFLLTLLAVLIAISTALLMSFVVGPRGAVGFMAGLGLAAFSLGLGGSSRAGILSAIAGFASVMTIGFGYLAPYLGVERDMKIKYLGWALGGVIIVVIGAELLMRRPKDVGVRENIA